jgi:hypothetical protein
MCKTATNNSFGVVTLGKPRPKSHSKTYTRDVPRLCDVFSDLTLNYKSGLSCVKSGVLNVAVRCFTQDVYKPVLVAQAVNEEQRLHISRQS